MLHDYSQETRNNLWDAEATLKVFCAEDRFRQIYYRLINWLSMSFIEAPYGSRKKSGTRQTDKPTHRSSWRRLKIIILLLLKDLFCFVNLRMTIELLTFGDQIFHDLQFRDVVWAGQILIGKNRGKFGNWAIYMSFVQSPT